MYGWRAETPQEMAARAPPVFPQDVRRCDNLFKVLTRQEVQDAMDRNERLCQGAPPIVIWPPTAAAADAEEREARRLQRVRPEQRRQPEQPRHVEASNSGNSGVRNVVPIRMQLLRDNNRLNNINGDEMTSDEIESMIRRDAQIYNIDGVQVWPRLEDAPSGRVAPSGRAAPSGSSAPSGSADPYNLADGARQRAIERNTREAMYLRHRHQLNDEIARAEANAQQAFIEANEHAAQRAAAAQRDAIKCSEQEQRLITRDTDVTNLLEMINKRDSTTETIPPDYLCPISQLIMSYPVTLEGLTYEKCAIEKWLTTSDTNPLTGLKIENNTLTPNIDLRSRITDYIESIKQRYLSNPIHVGDPILNESEAKPRSKPSRGKSPRGTSKRSDSPRGKSPRGTSKRTDSPRGKSRKTEKGETSEQAPVPSVPSEPPIGGRRKKSKKNSYKKARLRKNKHSKKTKLRKNKRSKKLH
jgi:type II secretory pathway pseudopilin PulG